mmetsp:Transcript_100151/g.311474  ORF Transcript_100151/g.311474 Transcript_100151/m.311474 type:complete len:376 (+) Transcript_100151:633-1760(+)
MRNPLLSTSIRSNGPASWVTSARAWVAVISLISWTTCPLARVTRSSGPTRTLPGDTRACIERHEGRMIPAMPVSVWPTISPSLKVARRDWKGGTSAQTPPNFTVCGKAKSRLASTVCTVYFDASGSMKRSMPFGCGPSAPKYRRQARGVAGSSAPRTRVWLCTRQTSCEISSSSFLLRKKGCTFSFGLPSAGSGTCTAVSIIPSASPTRHSPRSALLRGPLQPSTATPTSEPCILSSSFNALAMSPKEVPSYPCTQAMPKSHVLPGRLRSWYFASAASSATAARQFLCLESIVAKIGSSAARRRVERPRSHRLAAAAAATAATNGAANSRGAPHGAAAGPVPDERQPLSVSEGCSHWEVPLTAAAWVRGRQGGSR